mmetsp:Transcript_11739/g.28198  ORF Transcript_11739/g.28198 Transcript_11739/m.28198 type:complete len:389 (-) Transcript_11739:279-1445(-)
MLGWWMPPSHLGREGAGQTDTYISTHRIDGGRERMNVHTHTYTEMLQLAHILSRTRTCTQSRKKQMTDTTLSHYLTHEQTSDPRHTREKSLQSTLLMLSPLPHLPVGGFVVIGAFVLSVILFVTIHTGVHFGAAAAVVLSAFNRVACRAGAVAAAAFIAGDRPAMVMVIMVRVGVVGPRFVSAAAAQCRTRIPDHVYAPGRLDLPTLILPHDIFAVTVVGVAVIVMMPVHRPVLPVHHAVSPDNGGLPSPTGRWWGHVVDLTTAADDSHSAVAVGRQLGREVAIEGERRAGGQVGVIGVQGVDCRATIVIVLDYRHLHHTVFCLGGEVAVGPQRRTAADARKTRLKDALCEAVCVVACHVLVHVLESVIEGFSQRVGQPNSTSQTSNR